MVFTYFLVVSGGMSTKLLSETKLGTQQIMVTAKIEVEAILGPFRKFQKQECKGYAQKRIMFRLLCLGSDLQIF